MSIPYEWRVAVFKCKPEQVREVLVGLYRFCSDLEGVKSLHFLSKDHVDGEVVFSFRIRVETRLRRVVKSKLAYKLGELLGEDKYAVDPTAGAPLEQYVDWSPAKRIEEFGAAKFDEFTGFLGKLSAMVVELFDKGYSGSAERVELSYLISGMLCCTEYGSLTPTGMDIGYYDRVTNNYRPYLRQDFQKQE
jgi:hypothetical protein